MATITIDGELILDETAGIQEDDADLVVTAGALANGGGSDGGRQIDQAFLDYINSASVGLTGAQRNFAANVDGASQDGMVDVTVGPNETVTRLFFSDANGNDLNGVLVSGVTTTNGNKAIYLYTAPGSNGKIVLATDAAPNPAQPGVVQGNVVAAFYLDTTSADANNSITSAGVQSIVFTSLKHPINPDPNDPIDFSDVLRVSAVITSPLGDQIKVLDDGPDINVADSGKNLTVDETVLTTDDTQSFAGEFTSDPGSDGLGASGITYALSTLGGVSGLVDTATNQNVVLSKNLVTGDIEGKTATGGDLVFKVHVAANGDVTLDQLRAVKHDDPATQNEFKTLSADNLVSLTATITDGDGDTDAATLNIGTNLRFYDDAPAAPVLTKNALVREDETAGVNTGADPNAADDVTSATLPAALLTAFNAISASVLSYAKGAAPLVTVDNPANAFGADGPAAAPAVSLGYALSAASAGAPSGLSTSDTNTQIFLYNGTGALAGLVLGRIGTEAGATDTANPAGQIAFALAVDASGVGYSAEFVALKHDTAGGTAAAFDDVATLANAGVQVTVTRTDGDGDSSSSTLAVGDRFQFQDDGPSITQAVVNLTLGNADTPILGSQAFGYDLGADNHGSSATPYPAGKSDFVADIDAVTAGNQTVTLTGTVGSGSIVNASTTLVSESATAASFNFTFQYDADPLTANNPNTTATGVLSFDKVNDTYSVLLNQPISGYSFDVLHTGGLQEKAPSGNTGHPQIVAERLTPTGDASPFFVEFTANSNPNGSPFGFNATGDGNPIAGDTTYNNGQLVTSSFEDWVSATQSTNGVAGDTIQKGELLTLRFFNNYDLTTVNPNSPGGGTERTDPNTAVSGLVIKFDGIGNSEDLMLILDLLDNKGTASTADDVITTRAIRVDNDAILKLSNGGVPAPYNSIDPATGKPEFTLDNNDGLVIIESNDYNGANEHFQIRGVQIMQSANGLTGNGTAIDLNGAVGANGGSSTTSLVNWDVLDQDVLKIVDIGFVRTNSGTLDAHLNFGLQIKDGDGDTTDVQHLLVDVLTPETLASLGMHHTPNNGWLI